MVLPGVKQIQDVNMQVLPANPLRPCYDVSGTDIAYAAIIPCAPTACPVVVPSTPASYYHVVRRQVNSATCLRNYAISLRATPLSAYTQPRYQPTQLRYAPSLECGTEAGYGTTP
eukprot:31925-Rhodomonas_salina.1